MPPAAKKKRTAKKRPPTQVQLLRKQWRAKLKERNQAVVAAKRELRSLGIKPRKTDTHISSIVASRAPKNT